VSHLAGKRVYVKYIVSAKKIGTIKSIYHSTPSTPSKIAKYVDIADTNTMAITKKYQDSMNGKNVLKTSTNNVTSVERTILIRLGTNVI
jgi:hypothetical protein